MRANEIKPSWLKAAKSTAQSFVQNQPKSINIGIVSFSSTASIVQTPTRDREAVIAAISRLRIGERTAIGSAILTSLDAIFELPSTQPTPTSNDVLGNVGSTPTFTPVPRGSYAPVIIVLLTDGTDLQKVYENLGTKLVFDPEQTELTAEFTEFGVLILLIAGIIVADVTDPTQLSIVGSVMLLEPTPRTTTTWLQCGR